MHITDLTIASFRNLKDLVLKDLGQVNLLVGENDSGKTSALEAIALYCQPLRLQRWIDTAKHRNALQQLDSQDIQWLFPKGDRDILIASPDRALQASRSGHEIQVTIEKLVAYHSTKTTTVLRDGNPPIADASHEIPVRFASSPLCINHEFDISKSDIVSLLQKLDPDISDIEIPQANAVYLRHKSLGLAPISVFGKGINQLFRLAVQIEQAKDGLLLIDEIDLGIHNDALASFFWLVNWDKQFNVQIFATTHSLEAIDSMIDATSSDAELVLFRLEPIEGKTRIVRHGWERLKRLREDLGQDVR